MVNQLIKFHCLQTRTVIQEGEDLSAIITMLNTTMFQLLATLDGPIHEGLDLANSSVALVEEGVASSQEIIAVTQTALTDAHYAITGGMCLFLFVCFFSLPALPSMKKSGYSLLHSKNMKLLCMCGFFNTQKGILKCVGSVRSLPLHANGQLAKVKLFLQTPSFQEAPLIRASY